MTEAKYQAILDTRGALTGQARRIAESRREGRAYHALRIAKWDFADVDRRFERSRR
jgi:hypothetical protein